jgi:hypothetical protein
VGYLFLGISLLILLVHTQPDYAPTERVHHWREEIVAPDKIMVHLLIRPFGIATEQGI